MEELQTQTLPSESKFISFVKKHKFKISISVVVLLVALGVGYFLITNNSKKVTEPVVEAVPEPEKPLIVPSLINGVMVSPELSKRRSVAVMIGNSPDARPQTGLIDADIVYEAYVEGNITRFLAIFKNTLTERVGPVRSARSYFIDYLSEYDSVYVYSGGSPAALSMITRNSIKGYPHATDGTFWREPRPGISSEHTLFANVNKIFQNSITKKGWPGEFETNSWKFKDALTPQTNVASTVVINYGGLTYRVEWIFDPKTNTYSRVMASAPHLDQASRQQITASTVIVKTVDRRANSPYAGTGRESEWTMNTIGTGPVSIFQDGVRIDGVWRKSSRTDRTRFFDSLGAEIAINRGKIWVQIIAPTTPVTVD